MSEPSLLDFPLLAQDATPEQIEASVVYLQSLPLAQLRMRQGVHEQQIAWAREQSRDDVAISERIKFDMTTDAISRQAFGQRMDGLHTASRPGDLCEACRVPEHDTCPLIPGCRCCADSMREVNEVKEAANG